MYYRCCLLIALQLKCASLEARATYAVLQGMGYESLMGMEKFFKELEWVYFSIHLKKVMIGAFLFEYEYPT